MAEFMCGIYCATTHRSEVLKLINSCVCVGVTIHFPHSPKSGQPRTGLIFSVLACIVTLTTETQSHHIKAVTKFAQRSDGTFRWNGRRENIKNILSYCPQWTDVLRLSDCVYSLFLKKKKKKKQKNKLKPKSSVFGSECIFIMNPYKVVDLI